MTERTQHDDAPGSPDPEKVHTFDLIDEVPGVSDGAPTPDDRARFESSFALGDDETLAGAVADLDRVRAELLDRWHATDPGGDALEPPAPWFGRTEPTPSVERYRMVHLVTEVARHAGHADIVREQLDGASSTSLLAAVEGWPANDFV
ncbi:mycothiol transferase, partial [Promicromonospora citrea]|uniref:mycothiol transferase n=1 Tax=Promicromonospora citrea TaxID=43677 RepID=UPI001BB24705